MNTIVKPLKILEILKVFQIETNNFDYISALKYCFFADRYHMRKYGVLMTGDRFFAMKQGPVASNIKNIIKKDMAQLSHFDVDAQFAIKNSITHKNNRNDKLAKFYIEDKNYFKLSKSVIKSIDFVLEKFSSFDQDQLVELTHDYPEWKKYESFFMDFPDRRKSMLLIDFFNNPAINESKALGKYFNWTDPFADDVNNLEIVKENFINFNT